MPKSSFLVACTRLYTSLCWSVHPSVGRSVCPLVITSRFWAFRAKRRAYLSYCPCPDNILPLPTRTRLMLPCIRPCSIEVSVRGQISKENQSRIRAIVFHCCNAPGKLAGKIVKCSSKASLLASFSLFCARKEPSWLNPAPLLIK